MLVCRGCCCGTLSKHPDVDHAGHLAALQDAVGGIGGARVFTVDCLDQCDRSNVVVVRTGGARRWFAGMLDDGPVADLATWLADGGRADLPGSLDVHAFDPDAPAPGMAVMDDRQGVALAEWVAELLRAGGMWTMGVPGACAELSGAGAHVASSADARTVTATTADGALRMHISDDTRAFVVGRADRPEVPAVIVFARVDPGPPVHRRITELGADHAAIDPGARADVLVDLGVGRSSAFAVRIADPAALDRVRAAVGHDWRDVLDGDGLGDAHGIGSPDRVVLTTVGRIEVSPAAHAHLHQGELELGVDLPLGLQVPKGFVVGAVHFPT